MSEEDDAVPVSVRLGEVVPPEDPEDWTRPLTWVAATGMLAGPLVALAWFLVARPAESGTPLPGTWLVAAALAAGAAAAGSTQLGASRAFAGTATAGLFGALVVVVLGVVMAGERQVGEASPTLAHALVAALAGLGGTLAAATLAPALVRLPSRLSRAATTVPIGIAVSLLVVPLVL